MPLYEDNEKPDPVDESYRRQDLNTMHIRALQRKRILGVWMNPLFQNSWEWAGEPYAKYQYRLIFDDTIQDRGTIAGGSSSTVAYIVPEPWRPTDGRTVAWVATVISTGYVPARFELNGANGEVKVFF